MNISRRGLLAGAGAAVVAASVPAWLLSRGTGAGPQTGRPEHVILVDWDGFDPDYLDLAPTPNIDALAGRGSLSVADGVYPTISNPARASMSTGAYPEKHGNAAYYFDEETGKAVGETRFLAAETISEALAAGGKTTAAVQWYMVQDHGASYGDPEHLYVRPDGLFEQRVDAAVEILNLRPVDSGGEMTTVPKIPDFLAVYGPDLDAFGHEEGAESPNMGPLLAELDRQLGRIVRTTKEVGVYERTAFILTSDHGMTSWERSFVEGLAATPDLGRGVEIVPPGRAPSPETEVILVKSAGLIMDVTLRGRAATPERRADVQRALEELPQISRVLDAGDLDDLGAGEKIGDFVVEARAPWGFGFAEPEEGASRGGHGSTREMRVPLLISGSGVKAGAVPENARLVDVAPTIAALLGIRPLADAQGRVLDELLYG
ncbi:sulfatase-like hydrolase/transferase [Rubrobacter tropicus]|uniref:Sulfatase-like hydrolase/transferase n=1 Tax=Rubrobacter tropicus TaxID=2653851 RepID=A0A6G8QAW1_9ACTN|nr:ectonucleotide pyrophosphatase/phosphodiesterase [Rubrobacter tropicus]QIN83568.1 sulfatase-like hydrolase/transferase [Rubrobacter tropicus]